MAKEKMPASAASSRVRRNPKLEELKRRRFSPQGKEARISRSLAALNQKGFIQLDPDEWKWVAEDSDAEDQFL